MPVSKKDGNPKDVIGSRKWGQFSCLPMDVLTEVSAGLYEGSGKYGRHNYRVKGVMASVYFDAIMRHLIQWWEGEDIDKDSAQHHLVKLIAGAMVLRSAMLHENWVDDRPPVSDLDFLRETGQKTVDKVIKENPEFVESYTEINKNNER